MSWRRWRRRVLSSMSVVSFTRTSALRFALLLLLLGAVLTAFLSFPLEKMLKDLLLWIKRDLGPWGPLVLSLVYIPLTILAVPASILSVGGGYLFGLPVGFVADSLGATMGATSAFFVGRTIGRSYVMSKLKNYPKFQSVAIAVRKSGFKEIPSKDMFSYFWIVLLLRLVPLLPFNVLNYLLSVTPVHVGDFVLASLLGMMPITFGFVYLGTTLKDLSDVTHGWHEVSKTHWVFMVMGFLLSVIMIASAAKVGKLSLEKALAENAEIGTTLRPSMLPIVADSPLNCHNPLIIKIDSMREDGHK